MSTLTLIQRAPGAVGRAFGLVALMAALPIAAQAQTLSFATTPSSLYESHTMSVNGGTSYGSSTIGAASLTSASTGTFWAYCIDPRTSINWSNSYTSTSLSNFLTGGRYTSQFAQAGYTAIAGTGYDDRTSTQVQNSLINLFSHAYADSLTSSTRAAAFGYAVWEIMGEAGYGTTTGGFRSNEVSAWRTQADAYLSALSTNAWSNVNGANLSATTNYTYTVYYTGVQGGSQSFLRVGVPGGTGVPEPGSLGLLAAAAVGAMGLSSRRRHLVAQRP